MTHYPAGAEVGYTVTYLEMTERPKWPHPRLPANISASLIRADSPPAWYFLALYGAVGRDWSWEDMFERGEDEIASWLIDPTVSFFTLLREGWPQGFFVLDARDPGTVDLAYFGLVPEAIGLGLGTFLLRTAILSGWDIPGTERLTLNTCSLDHPRALQTYQRQGFRLIRREDHRRILKRARDIEP